MPTSYLLLKTIHVVAAIVFVGNVVATAVWKTLADRTQDPRVVAFGQRLVTVTDFVLTGPGAVAVLITGLLMMRSYQVPLVEILWLLWGLILFGAAGLLWVAVLVPVQLKQARLVRDLGDGEIPEEYWRLDRVWAVVGMVATLLPLINVYLMVMKPS